MKNFIVACIVIISITSISKPIFPNDYGLTQEIYSKLCGIWDIGVQKTYKRKVKVCEDTHTYMMACQQMSWGKAEIQVNVSTMIDLGEDKPNISWAGGGVWIKKITKNGEQSYTILARFSRNSYNYNDFIERDFKVYFVDDERIIFPKMEWFKEFPILPQGYGKETIYTKTDGPVIKYFKPKIINLRLRSEPFSNGKIIRMMTKEDKLLIMVKGKNDTIEGVKGNWVRVLTDQNEIGWCFDAYLQNY